MSTLTSSETRAYVIDFSKNKFIKNCTVEKTFYNNPI